MTPDTPSPGNYGSVLSIVRAFVALFLMQATFVGGLGVAIADDEEMVSFPARILKVETFEHGESPTGNRVAAVFGLFGMLAYQSSLQSTWYKLNNPEGEAIGIEAPGEFSVGQCVRIYVRKANAQNTKLFPGVSRMEPYDGCAP